MNNQNVFNEAANSLEKKLNQFSDKLRYTVNTFDNGGDGHGIAIYDCLVDGDFKPICRIVTGGLLKETNYQYYPHAAYCGLNLTELHKNIVESF